MNSTPLRKDLVRWCEYKYIKERDLYYRENGKVLLRLFPSGKWFAYLIAAPGEENQFLCEVEGLGHLTLLCLALDGDCRPLIIKITKKKK